MANLVLTRKVGEKVVIGEGRTAVVMTLIEIDRNRVKVMFEAPRSVKIDRHEIREYKQGEADADRQIEDYTTGHQEWDNKPEGR